MANKNSHTPPTKKDLELVLKMVALGIPPGDAIKEVTQCVTSEWDLLAEKRALGLLGKKVVK